jgi:hypothetical protein
MDLKKCICCKNEVLENSTNCKFCDFPFSGSDEEKSKHIGRFIVNKRVISDSEDSLEKNQYLLYIISAITFISAIIFFNKIEGFYFETVLSFFNGFVIFFCGFFLKRKPTVLTIIPLVLILSMYLLNYLIDPNTLFKGIAFKLIIITSLVYNIFLIQKSNSFKKNHNLTN